MAATLETALAAAHVPPNELHTSPLENGHSIALVVMYALLAESATRRTQYALEDIAERNPLRFLQAAFPDCAVLPDLTEVFVARDLIAHNHVWEASIQWDADNNLHLLDASLLSGGDRKFKEVLNTADRTTNRLGLNLFPPRVNLQDAAIALRVVERFLTYLEEKDRTYFYMSPQIVEFRGRVVDFETLVSAAESAIRPA
jgi:hypothetical protein